MNHTSISSDHVQHVCRRPSLLSALAQLSEAHEFAHESESARDEYCIELSCLILGGSSAAAAQWLIDANYARIAGERGMAHAPGNGNQIRPKNAGLTDHSRLALTERGLQLVRACNGKIVTEKDNSSTNPSTEKPRCNRNKRELWVGNQLIKRLTRTATNQLLILEVFEEEGWPASIDDPFPGGTHQAKRKRLNNAVERLNHGHLLRRLRFRTNGNGDGVRWEISPPNRPTKIQGNQPVGSKDGSKDAGH